MPPIRIGDPEDPRLADFAALSDAALRKRYEQQRGVLIAEGPAPVRALTASPYPLRSVLLSEPRTEAMDDVVAAADARGVPVYVVTRELLYELVRFRLHQGVLACGERLEPTAPDELLTVGRRLAVLEGVGDPENLGALFRSARAFGIDAVFLGPGCADPLYRRSVRVSMGHVLHLPHARIADVAAVVDALEVAGVRTLALTPDRRATPVGALELAADAPVALLLGAEGPGLSARVLERAATRVRVPLDAEVDSLNVAVAGAIAFHALADARR